MTSTNISELSSDFPVWHYRWCLAQTEQELKDGFPWLRQIQNSIAQTYIAELMQLDWAKRHSLARALVKRFHLNALRLQNEEISASEKDAIANFLRNADSARISRRELRSENVAERALIDKGGLKAEIRARLDLQFGKPISIGGGAFRYTRRLTKFDIHTDIDLGGSRTLGYLHSVSSGHKRLHKWISLLQWHGISSHTTWDYMSPGDEIEVAAFLESLCMRFTNAFQNFADRSASAFHS